MVTVWGNNFVTHGRVFGEEGDGLRCPQSRGKDLLPMGLQGTERVGIKIA